MRLRAVGDNGVGGTSTELQFVVGAAATTPPAPPVAPVVTTTADTIAMSWYPLPRTNARHLHPARRRHGRRGELHVPILGPGTFFSTTGVPPSRLLPAALGVERLRHQPRDT